MADAHAGIWLKLVGGIAKFPHYEHIEQPQSVVDPSRENWWQGIFRLAESERLVLSDGANTEDLRFYLHLASSLDANATNRASTGFGNLHYLDGADPPLVDGVLVLAPNAFRSVVDCIRSGSARVEVLLWLLGLESDFSGDETQWNVEAVPRPAIEHFELNIHYGEPQVPRRTEET